jgi:hypothetical protein
MKSLFAIAALAGGACTDRAASQAPATGGSAEATAAAGDGGAGAPGDARARTPCLPEDESLYLVLGEPLRACAGKAKRCVSVALASGEIAEVAFVDRPRKPELPHAVIEDHGGKWSSCFDGACKPLGKNARAALDKLHAARASKPPHPDEVVIEPTGTTDLKAVFVPGEELEIYNIKKDRSMLSRGPQSVDAATAVGTMLVTRWAPPETAVYTSKGKQLVELGPGAEPGMIDDKRWLLLSPYHEIYFFDDTAKPAFQKIDLDPDSDSSLTLVVDFAVLADKSVAVVMGTPGAASVFHLDPVRPTIVKRWQVALCSRAAAAK